MNRNNKILITGASGFLGSALLEHLVENGFDVNGIARDTSSLWRIKDDYTSKVFREPSEHWLRTIAHIQPDTLICLNWNGVDSENREDMNLQSTSADFILEMAVMADRMNIRKFITFGSQAESAPSSELIPERSVQSGTSKYGKSKIALRDKVLNISSDSTSYVWVRVFSIYGPKDHPNTYISQLIKSKHSELDFVTNDRNLLWSYLYVSDFCTAVQEIIESNDVRGVINLGNDSLYSLGEIEDLVLNAGSKTYEGERRGFYPDLQTLRYLGWRPKISIQDGLRNTENWLSSNSIQNSITSESGTEEVGIREDE